MTNRTKRLELTWIGKEERPRLEPRILLEDKEQSYARRVSDKDIFDNMLIHGDNLLALKALEQEFTGKVQCIYIDPPFNTGQAFEHYDDGLEHSLWLSMMRDRLVILHSLLHETGTLFLHIDDNELGYLIAVADEIFGRPNRISVITFKQSSVSGPKAINAGFVSTASYIVVYAKRKAVWKSFKVYSATERDDRYSKYIENFHEPSEKWRLISLKDAFAKAKGLEPKALRKGAFESDLEAFVLDEAERVVRTARIAPKDVAEDVRPVLAGSTKQPGKVLRASRTGKDDMYFLNGEQLIFYASKVREVNGERVTGQALSTIWDDLLSNNLHNEGGVDFPKGKKPELLIKRCLDVATTEGDLVLDSFGGSGTTAAVAHKMRRRWITVELGPHAQTHCVPRLRAVIDGTDRGGATEATGWTGGGGFRFFKLAPSLLEKDKWGNWVVSKQYNPEMLAEAMCKLEGFRYAPDREVFWNHGRSTDRDFLYVTTQNLSREQLQLISEQVGEERTLLICCGAFRGNPEFPNLTVKKIPQAVLARCEWGRDDYSLNVTEQAPVIAGEEAKAEASSNDASKGGASETKTGGRRKTPSAMQELPLFAGVDKGSKRS
jgi:adenine-specific DNA-methyltransferase